VNQTPSLRLALCVPAALFLAATPDAPPQQAPPFQGPDSPEPLSQLVRAQRSTDKAPAGQIGSGVATDSRRHGTWIADGERDELVFVDDDFPGDSGSARHVTVGSWPEQLVIDHTGRIFVTCRAAGRIDVVSATLSVQSIPVGPEPRAIALDEEAHTVYVGLVTPRELVSIDLGSLAVTGRVALDAEPWAIAVTPQGIAVLPSRGSSLIYVDAAHGTTHDVPLFAPGRQAWHGQALVFAPPDLLIAIHSGVDTGLGQAVPSGGYGGSIQQPVVELVTTIDRGQPVSYPGDLSTVHQIPVADVTGAVVAFGNLVVASRGTGELVSLPLSGFFTQAATASASGSTSATPQNQAVSFRRIGTRRLQSVSRTTAAAKLRQIIAAERNVRRVRFWPGVQGLAVGENGSVRSFAAFTRDLVSVEPNFDKWTHVNIGPGRLDAEMARGRALFYDAANRGIAASMLACATCHPDGREDGLVWRLQGERRQTPMLAARLVNTAPYNWLGTGKTVADNVRQTIARLGGTGLPKKDVNALARYILQGLRTPSVPIQDQAEKVALGRRLFHDDQVGCATCHPSDASFTDGSLHEIGTTSAVELDEMHAVNIRAKPQAFDTPSLQFVALTPPYFHDGSVKTLEDLIANNGDRMGHTSQLSPEERAALVAYLRTL
jgi:hypothetical protein